MWTINMIMLPIQDALNWVVYKYLFCFSENKIKYTFLTLSNGLLVSKMISRSTKFNLCIIFGAEFHISLTNPPFNMHIMFLKNQWLF